MKQDLKKQGLSQLVKPENINKKNKKPNNIQLLSSSKPKYNLIEITPLPLPSDFRTSLILPQLKKRFSVLRRVETVNVNNNNKTSSISPNTINKNPISINNSTKNLTFDNKNNNQNNMARTIIIEKEVTQPSINANAKSEEIIPSESIESIQGAKKMNHILSNPTKDRPNPPRTRPPSIQNLASPGYNRWTEQLNNESRSAYSYPRSNNLSPIIPPTPLSPLDKLSEGIFNPTLQSMIVLPKNDSGLQQQQQSINNVTAAYEQSTSKESSSSYTSSTSSMFSDRDSTSSSIANSLQRNNISQSQQKVDQQKIGQQTIGQQKVGQQKIIQQQKTIQQKVIQQKVTQQRVDQQKVSEQKVGKQQIEQQRNSQQGIIQQQQQVGSQTTDVKRCTVAPPKPQPPPFSLTDTLIASGQADVANQVLVMRRVQKAENNGKQRLPSKIPLQKWSKQKSKNPKISGPQLVSASSNIKTVPIVTLRNDRDNKNKKFGRKFSIRENEIGLGKSFRKIRDVFTSDSETNRTTLFGKKHKYGDVSPYSSSENLPKKFTSEGNLNQRYIKDKNKSDLLRQKEQKVHKELKPNNTLKQEDQKDNLLDLLNNNNYENQEKNLSSSNEIENIENIENVENVDYIVDNVDYIVDNVEYINENIENINNIENIDNFENIDDVENIYNNIDNIYNIDNIDNYDDIDNIDNVMAVSYTVSDSDINENPTNPRSLPKKQMLVDQQVLYDIDALKRHAEMVATYSSFKKDHQNQNSQLEYVNPLPMSVSTPKLKVDIPMKSSNFLLSPQSLSIMTVSESHPNSPVSYNSMSPNSDAPPLSPRNPLRNSNNLNNSRDEKNRSLFNRTFSLRRNNSAGSNKEDSEEKRDRISSSRLMSIFNGNRSRRNSKTNDNNFLQVPNLHNSHNSITEDMMMEENSSSKKEKNKVIRRTIIITKPFLPPLPESELSQKFNKSNRDSNGSYNKDRISKRSSSNTNISNRSRDLIDELSNIVNNSNNNQLSVPMQRSSLYRPPTPIPSASVRESVMDPPYGIPIPPIPKQHRQSISSKRTSKSSILSTNSISNKHRKSTGGKSIQSSYGESLYDYYTYSDHEGDDEGEEENKDIRRSKRDTDPKRLSNNSIRDKSFEDSINEEELQQPQQRMLLDQHVEVLEMSDEDDSAIPSPLHLPGVMPHVTLPRLLEEMTRGLGNVELENEGEEREGIMTVEEKLEQVMKALGVDDRDIIY
ncbi:2290_t:CDS:2 [Diversispora eburnea]|uniref:2290_t:CDS:1 n=1 Tax=Diversispora eburnea TaxID=1213867 RepID=A0A9N9F0Y1_9GLOM|nr:2290_t:CDS:2 [Diversispora eburnea]